MTRHDLVGVPSANVDGEKHVHVGRGSSVRSLPDGTIKRSGSEAEALTDILQEQIALDFSVQRDLYR